MAKDSINMHIGAKDAASAVIQGVTARTVAMGMAIYHLTTKALAGLINGLRSWVSEALEAEAANVKLDAALRGMGQYTPELAKQYRDLANAVQDETGASDESVKANIAQLTTLGVMSDKMAVATRSVAALAAMGRDGNQSMVAVARALTGDIAGFERLSPAVRNATTITGKYAAANAMLAAGYAQQKANLSTVGGAWKALQGRLGDAREDILGAVFDGLRLGKTFDSMQASVGKFLKSDTFTGFTEALRSGAAYALDIGKALTAKGGTAEVAAAFGNIILAALQDGADYVKEAITSGFGSMGGMGGVTKGMFSGWWKPGKMPMDRAAGNILGNMIEGGLWGGGKKKGNLEKALEDFAKAVKSNADKVDEQTEAVDDGMDEYLAYLADQKVIDDQAQAMSEAAVKAKKKIAEAEKKKADFEEKTLAWEEMIEGFAKDEAEAKQKVARNQQRLAQLAGQNTSEYINSRQQERSDEKDRAKAERSAQHRLSGIRRKLGMGEGDDYSKLNESIENAGKRGIHLGKRQREMIGDARDQENLRKAANDQMIKARNDEIENRKLKDAGEATLAKQRAQNAANIQKIADNIEGAMEAQN